MMNDSTAVNGVDAKGGIKVMGIDLNKVDASRMREIAAEILEGGDAPMSLKDLVAKLQRKFLIAVKDPEQELAACDSCGGKSPDVDGWPGCPFCGEEDEVVGSPDKPPAAKAAAPVKPPAKPARTNPIASKAEDKPKANGAHRDAKPANGAALVALPMPPRALAPVELLDRAVAHVGKLQGEGAAWAWHLGKYVREEIYEKDLWMQRKGADGKAAYKGFKHFVEAELGLAPNFVRVVMEISKRFTEADVVRVGTTKLGCIIQSPKENDETLMKRLEAGMSVRGVRAEVARIRSEQGVQAVTRAAKVGGAHRDTRNATIAAAESRVKVAAETVTAVLLAKRSTVPLLNGLDRPKKDEKPRAARRVKDVPRAVIECKNGSTIEVKIHENAAGELMLSYRPRTRQQSKEEG